MRAALILPLLFAVAACEGGTGGPPDAGPHAYLLLEPPSEQKGWDAISNVRAKLPSEERRRIRTAGLISNERSTMYIDFDGDCSSAATFVASARQLAGEAGVTRITCDASLPDAA